MGNPDFRPDPIPQLKTNPESRTQVSLPVQRSPEKSQNGKSAESKPVFQLPKWAIPAAVVVLGLAAFLHFEFAPVSADGYTKQQIGKLQVEFQNAHGHLQQVDLNSTDQVQKAEATMNLSQNQKDQIMDEVKTGHMKLGWITLWDDQSEDGDVVEVSSSGYSRVVYLKNQPETIAVPYADNGNIQLRGVKDGGGGGITVGIVTSAGSIDVPPMEEDQILDLPLQ